MSKPSFLIEPLGRRSLSVILASMLLLIITVSEVAPSQENKEVDTQKIIRRVVDDYIRDGKERYENGFFEQAEKTFLMAHGYKEYLTATQREQLTELLEKAQIAVLRRKRALETFRTVNELLKRDQLIQAKAHLERVRDNEFLPGRIAEEIKKSSNRSTSRKEEIAALYYRSIGFFHTGQLEKSREGFVEVMASGLMPASVEKKIGSYVAEIDGLLAERAAQELAGKGKKRGVAAVDKPEVIKSRLAEPSLIEQAIAELNLVELGSAKPNLVEQEKVPPKVGAPVTRQSSYIDVINLRRNILRSHTTAVVSDAIAKARKYIQQGQFDKAKEAVETAERVVNDNQLAVGDDQFTERNNRELKYLMEEIVQGQDEMMRRLAEQRRKDAIKAQQEFTEQMEIERQEKIARLLRNALAYQEQQRYEAALGQLESLLALDPQNDEALVLKGMLEDMIYFRKQLEVQKEGDRQRADILLKTDESGIPYAEELTYPKNWREIVEKPTRQPDKPIGLDPADVAVYEQL
ncbi:MAG: tetratricopeptide repeat protein, partial [Planctomycetota bacterium]